MRLKELYQIQKLYFGYEELSRILGINPDSARVAASRYVAQGLLLRLRRNLYVLKERWKNATVEEKCQIANVAQGPSYISLTTALAYYELTTQLQRDFFESIALRRTKEIFVDTSVLKYTKISKKLYFGFQKEKHFFIAKPEKALLDAFYLTSFGRYSLDFSAVERSKLDQEKVAAMSKFFPLRTKKLLRNHGYLPPT